ncbi:hypothetical protein SAMN05421874_10787 [Nonomuraea maritima]|uniref:Uncharacterized protein n=1 Tax=Nonomuraea maritima TaxID=683260 RepID=A0A1G9BC94_9ACTN|nr:hypothetical protein SAMN05421874_10787 [Nonomuraea maritima]
MPPPDWTWWISAEGGSSTAATRSGLPLLHTLIYALAGVLFAAGVVVVLVGGGKRPPLVIEPPITVDALVTALGEGDYRCSAPQPAVRFDGDEAIACHEELGHHPAVMTFGSRRTQDDAVARIKGFRTYGPDNHLAVGEGWAVNCGPVEACTEAAQGIVEALGGQMITIPSIGELPADSQGSQ